MNGASVPNLETDYSSFEELLTDDELRTTARRVLRQTFNGDVARAEQVYGRLYSNEAAHWHATDDPAEKAGIVLMLIEAMR